MRLKVIACDSLRREICAAAARSTQRTELEFLRPNHLQGPSRLALLQAVVDRAGQLGRPDGIVLAYALCGEGVAGVESHALPIAIPRMKNCIGFPAAEGGICVRSSGWTEAHGDAHRRPAVRVTHGHAPTDAGYEAYRQVTYLATAPPRELIGGSSALTLFMRLLCGEWTGDDILVLPPGWRVRASAGGVERERIR